MVNKIVCFVICGMFVAFGLGGGLEEGRNGNGFIMIELYEKKPKVEPMTISTHGIHLFTFEL
jgi:hypothetical protein